MLAFGKSVADRQDPSAHAVTCLHHRHVRAILHQSDGSGKTRQACADHDD
jgi:hypothetical protein